MLQVNKVITSRLKELNIGARSEQHGGAIKKKGDKKLADQRERKRPELKVETKRSRRKVKQENLKKRDRFSSESSKNNTDDEGQTEVERESNQEDSDVEPEARVRVYRSKRMPRPVCDWKLKYDGKDEGKGLNKFVSEVEFMAEAENISRRSLFNEAIHLFSGDARAWYIEGKRNREFQNWSELVAELKLEYQPPDLDYHYEQQAAARRQRRGEKFQDYYNAVKGIFEQMAIPPSEHRRFDIIFRNLRSDYKNSLLVKGVRTLRTLKVWGRKLDSANWFLYRKQEGDQGTRSSQLHEINTGSTSQGPRAPRNDWKDAGYKGRPVSKYQNAAGYQRTWNGNNGFRKPEQSKVDQPKPKPVVQNVESGEGNSKELLQKRVDSYRIPERTVCYNCRGNYHHSSACLKAKEIFCTTCGFQGFRKPDCPFCAKNGKRSM